MSLSRRHFLKSSATIVAGASIAPYHRIMGANDRLNVGLIGCRNMGWGNLNGFLGQPNVACLGLADIDQGILGRRKEEVSKKQQTKFETYGDYRRLLDNKDIDVVIIGTPDHWHCLQFVDACSAGKDIYVEKPIANSVAECDAMIGAANRHKRIVQVGQQQRSGNHWKEMVRVINSGELGKIGQVKIWANFNYAALGARQPDATVPDGIDFNFWLGPAPQRTFNPQRFHGAWRMFWDYGGGLMTDWGVHLLDMGLWAMNITGMPQKITGVGGKFYQPEGAHETFDTQQVTYSFPDFIMTWEHNAGVETGPYGRTYGVLFKGTNGTLVADRSSWQIYPEVNPTSKEPKTPEKEMNSDRREHGDHIRNFIDCVRRRDSNTACPIQVGGLVAKYAHFGNIAARLGGAALTYDDQKKSFGQKEADRYLRPAYRQPWVFPKI